MANTDNFNMYNNYNDWNNAVRQKYPQQDRTLAVSGNVIHVSAYISEDYAWRQVAKWSCNLNEGIIY